MDDPLKDNLELDSLDESDNRRSIHSTEVLLDEPLDYDDTVVTDSIDTTIDDPTYASEDPISKFMAACQSGDLDTVKQLVGEDPDLVTTVQADQITGLHWAAINNRLQVVRFLVENGSDANAFGGELEATPLHWACRNGLVYIADFLMTKGGADPTLRDGQSYNSLHLAVHSSNIMLVIYLLFNCCDPSNSSVHSLYVDETDSHGRTSLHWAAYQGDILTINTLLRFGADVSKLDDQQFIPLHWAFMRGQRNTLSRLVEAGSDIFAKTNAGKDSFSVAKDMNCEKLWEKVLKGYGRSGPEWTPVDRSEEEIKVAKTATFLIPYVLLPVCFSLCSLSQGWWFGRILLTALVVATTVIATIKFLAPWYIFEEVALAKTPFLAGVFSGTAAWSIIVVVFVLVPSLWRTHYFTTVVLLSLIGGFSYCFYKTMVINPGFVPVPADNKVVVGQISDLISIGKFDTNEFDVNMFVRKPLRSRYSRHSKQLIAKFDHFCPWVYNEIGVRNHKLFITFVYCLNLAIVAFVYLTLAYFDSERHHDDGYDSDDEDSCWFLDENSCYGFKKHPFMFNLMVWTIIQYIWISFLTVVQSFQVVKGVTTWELINLQNGKKDSKFNHSTVPQDFNAPVTPPSQAPTVDTTTRLESWLRVIGVDQFLLTMKLSVGQYLGRDPERLMEKPFIASDFGIHQNWVDFWFLGEPEWDNLFMLPIEGEATLNGEVVDYYRLYDWPQRA